ncbi:hypothetical protein [Methanobrevibacter sp.]
MISYKKITDKLTTNELNGIISLYRHFHRINREIKLTEHLIGDYAEYHLDIKGATIIDAGILITQETITAQSTITLTNTVYKTSNYYLTLKVLHNTSLNILDDLNSDFRVVDEITLTLKENEPVNIPVETLKKGYIISLDCEISIKHDKTIIQQM